MRYKWLVLWKKSFKTFEEECLFFLTPVFLTVPYTLLMHKMFSAFSHIRHFRISGTGNLAYASRILQNKNLKCDHYISTIISSSRSTSMQMWCLSTLFSLDLCLLRQTSRLLCFMSTAQLFHQQSSIIHSNPSNESQLLWPWQMDILPIHSDTAAGVHI